MNFRFTTFNVITMGLMALTFWLAAARFSMRQESNWPLFYYLGVFVYLRAFEGSLNPYAVYVGVVTGLFLRFEFLGEKLEKFLKVVELIFLGYIFWRGTALILLW
jgi:hypothetical protein